MKTYYIITDDSNRPVNLLDASFDCPYEIVSSSSDTDYSSLYVYESYDDAQGALCSTRERFLAYADALDSFCVTELTQQISDSGHFSLELQRR